jgi:phosphoribosyl-ATP pyrophosphohydrolase/phosphoribosyl-AMP cyclohydrolase
MLNLENLRFDAQGLIPAVVQTPGGELRMLAWMNREALEQSLAEGWVTFWSRSRQALWTKGATSGNRLRLMAIHPDCDGDALLVIAQPEGPTCHRGQPSCFDGDGPAAPPVPWLERLELLLKERKATASREGSYTQKLFSLGVDRIGKKVVEEAGEVVLAAKNLETRGSAEDRVHFLEEAADLLFHLEVLLVSQGSTFADAAEILRRRHHARS